MAPRKGEGVMWEQRRAEGAGGNQASARGRASEAERARCPASPPPPPAPPRAVFNGQVGCC